MQGVEATLRILDSAARFGEGIARSSGVPESRLRGDLRKSVEEVMQHLGYRLEKDIRAVKKRMPRRKFEFDRLEPGGEIALVQFEPDLLATVAGMPMITMILDGLLEHKLKSAFVFTDGTSIDEVFTDEIWPSYLGDDSFGRMRSFTKKKLDDLSADPIEDRAEQFKVWMGLPQVPPVDHDKEDAGFDQPNDVRKTVADALIGFGEEASNGIVKASYGKLPHELITGELGYRNRVPKLVDWADRHRRLQMLVLHSLRYQPDHSDLIDVAQRYELEATRMKRKDVDELIARKGLNLPSAVFRQRQGQMETRVCQVQIKKEPKGTGFLVAKDLVLTNYHVVEALFEDERLVPELRFRFDFKMKPTGEELYAGRYVKPIEGDKWIEARSVYHPDEKKGFAADVVPSDEMLDYALIRLAEPVGIEPVAQELKDAAPGVRGWIELPEAIEAKPGDPVYILHHPAGDQLRVNITADGVISFNDPDRRTRLFYRSGTMSGSSGSPCFSGEWELMAMHNSGDTIFKAFDAAGQQQGVPADKIRALLAKDGVKEFVKGD